MRWQSFLFLVNYFFNIFSLTHTGPLMVPDASRSPGLTLQPLTVWCASCCFMDQYMYWEDTQHVTHACCLLLNEKMSFSACDDTESLEMEWVSPRPDNTRSPTQRRRGVSLRMNSFVYLLCTICVVLMPDSLMKLCKLGNGMKLQI